MPARRRILMATVLCCSASTLLRADETPLPPTPADQEQAAEADLIQMTLKYDSAMLVVVSKEGAAGIRFIEPFELGNATGNGVVGVSYEWRFLERKPGAEEQTGIGRVFVKLVDSNVRDGSFAVTCGPIELTWAYKSKVSGVVQFNPRDLAVHPVAAHYFAERKAAFPAAPISLGRFLRLEDPAKRTGTAGPLLYRSGTLVVRDSNGIATFEFGAAFERARGANQTLSGVPYHFTFASPQGETSEGEGEVYETRTGGKYDNNNSQLELAAGPLRITWSLGGDDTGWIYYDPARNPIWCVDKPFAKQLVGVIAAGPHGDPSDK